MSASLALRILTLRREGTVSAWRDTGGPLRATVWRVPSCQHPILVQDQVFPLANASLGIPWMSSQGRVRHVARTVVALAMDCIVMATIVTELIIGHK